MRKPIPIATILCGAISAISTALIAPDASAITTVYNRTAAVAYADANWNKVVSDGYFWINGSTANYYGAGAAVPVNVPGEAGGIGDDCAHFVSSCIGTPGGGLTVPNRAGTYGEPGAARLNELLTGNSLGGYGTTYKVATVVNSISGLTPGDVIGYDWTGNGGGSMSGIDHVGIYVGNNLVDTHATSHKQVHYTLGGATNYFFVHITLPDTIVPTKPTTSFPTPGATITSMTPTLMAGAFTSTGIGSKQVAAQWQVYQSSTMVYDSGIDTTNLTSFVVPTGKLSAGNSYNWQVRYEDNYGGWSTYSAASAFATAPVPEPVGLIGVVGGMVIGMRRRRFGR